MRLIYPKTMAKLSTFEKWLANVIVDIRVIGEDIPEDVLSINTLPSNLTTSYHISMHLGTIFEWQVQKYIY